MSLGYRRTELANAANVGYQISFLRLNVLKPAALNALCTRSEPHHPLLTFRLLHCYLPVIVTYSPAGT